MATRTKITKAEPTRKPEPWWHGLSQATADELLRRGYQSREDALLFTERLHYPGRTGRARQMPHDPLYLTRPWLGPRLISVEIVNEVREWLGADPV